MITSFLLADARTTERTFELLNEEGAFPKLVDLVQAPKQGNEAGLHRLLMELLYEMSRIQKISLADLGEFMQNSKLLQSRPKVLANPLSSSMCH